MRELLNRYAIVHRGRTLSEFHYNRVFVDSHALTSEARLHAELRFKLGLPADYDDSWDALVACLSSIGTPEAHLCRYWDYTPTKRLVLSIRGFPFPGTDPTHLMSLAAATARANDRLREAAKENRVWLEFAVDPND